VSGWQLGLIAADGTHQVLSPVVDDFDRARLLMAQLLAVYEHTSRAIRDVLTTVNDAEWEHCVFMNGAGPTVRFVIYPVNDAQL
jgi:hypothetical protein